MPHPGPHQARAKEIYTELRDNLIKNIFKVRTDACFSSRLFPFAFLWLSPVHPPSSVLRSTKPPATSGSSTTRSQGRGREGSSHLFPPSFSFPFFLPRCCLVFSS